MAAEYRTTSWLENRSRRDKLGINYVTVQQPQAEAFGPVVSRLRGL